MNNKIKLLFATRTFSVLQIKIIIFKDGVNDCMFFVELQFNEYVTVGHLSKIQSRWLLRFYNHSTFIKLEHSSEEGNRLCVSNLDW